MKLFDQELWQDHAICSQTDPEAFFLEYSGPGSSNYRESKRVCDGCPVRLECLNKAVRNHEKFGLWGGFAGHQLRALVRSGREYDTLAEAVEILDSL